MTIFRDERTVSPAELAAGRHGTPLAFSDVLPTMASPDTREALEFDVEHAILTDSNGNRYPLRYGLPLLVPARLQAYYSDKLSIPYSAISDAFLQYYYLSNVKQSGVIGEINASAGDVHYQRHLFRLRDFMASARGKVLDVGCDDPAVGVSILPAGASYLGLDPFCLRNEPFRVIGFGEHLPFHDESYDAVLFNTSLDHILDWRKAISEAARVLTPGGILYICTLVWTDRAELIFDAVHFHHFRDYEIYGALRGWEVIAEKRYDYKGATHRHGLYLAVRKPLLPASGS